LLIKTDIHAGEQKPRLYSVRNVYRHKSQVLICRSILINICCCLFVCSAYETPRIPPPGGTFASPTYTTIQQPATPELNDYLTMPTGTGDDGYEIPMSNYVHVTASPPRDNAHDNVPKNPRGLNNHASNRLG